MNKEKLKDQIDGVIDNFFVSYADSNNMEYDEVNPKLEKYDVGKDGLFIVMRHDSKVIGSVLIMDSTDSDGNPETTMLISAYYDGKSITPNIN